MCHLSLVWATLPCPALAPAFRSNQASDDGKTVTILVYVFQQLQLPVLCALCALPKDYFSQAIRSLTALVRLHMPPMLSAALYSALTPYLVAADFSGLVSRCADYSAVNCAVPAYRISAMSALRTEPVLLAWVLLLRHVDEVGVFAHVQMGPCLFAAAADQTGHCPHAVDTCPQREGLVPTGQGTC